MSALAADLRRDVLEEEVLALRAQLAATEAMLVRVLAALGAAALARWIRRGW